MDRSLLPFRKRWYNLVRLFGFSAVRSSLGCKLLPFQLDRLEELATKIVKENIVNNSVSDDITVDLFADSFITFSK